MEGNKNDCDGIVKQLNGSLESFKKQLVCNYKFILYSILSKVAQSSLFNLM
jgi:hypothetical protein